MRLSTALCFLLYLDDSEDGLSIEEKRRRDRRIPRAALRNYYDSPFMHLHASGNDQALLNCCACDHVVFAELLHHFDPCFNACTFDDWTCKIRKMKLTKYGRKYGRQRDGAFFNLHGWDITLFVMLCSHHS